MPAKRDKDPNRPKRPTSAYFYYMAREREEAKKRGESISKVAEWTKRVSAKWRELTDPQKKPFEAQAGVDKERYQREMAEYTPTGGSGGKRAAKDPNKPKRAQSAYFLFLGDFRAENKHKFQQEGGHKDLIRAAGEAWNKLSESEKTPYQERHQVEKAKCDAAMANYEAGGGGAAKKAKMAPVAVDDEDDEEDDDEEEEEEEDSD